MPIMDGYEASRSLRNMMCKGLIPDVPIIAINANVGNSDKDIWLKNGMDYFLAKPLKKTELLREMEIALRRKDKKISLQTQVQQREDFVYRDYE